MIARLIDKLIFGVALIVSLQLPLLVEHYHQYLSGVYKATQWQVDGYEATAKAHQFANANAMIQQHLTNSDASVRADAEQKQVTVELLQELTLGMDTFADGHLLQKIGYMLHPARLYQVREVAQNFKPGIPLDPSGLLFALVCALVLNSVIMLPFRLFGSRRRSHQRTM